MKLLAALPLALGALLAPCKAPEAPQRPQVVVFGDSNAKMAEAAARPLWGDVDVDYNAIAGYSIDDWAQEMAQVPDGAVVIVALGANDVLEDELPALDVAPALDLLDGHCVAWVTVNEDSFPTEPFRSRVWSLNDTIKVSGAHVQDWSAHAGDVLGPDHIHHTAAGNEAYARELVGARELCP